MPVRKLLFALLGLLAVALLAAVIGAPYLSQIPGFKLEELGGVARVRLLGAGAFVAVLILRLFVQPPRKRSRKQVVWSELATSTGGAGDQGVRGVGKKGWDRGEAGRGDVRGPGGRVGRAVV